MPNGIGVALPPGSRRRTQIASIIKSDMGSGRERHVVTQASPGVIDGMTRILHQLFLRAVD
jgi:hypothetical protein